MNKLWWTTDTLGVSREGGRAGERGGVESTEVGKKSERIVNKDK